MFTTHYITQWKPLSHSHQHGDHQHNCVICPVLSSSFQWRGEGARSAGKPPHVSDGPAPAGKPSLEGYTGLLPGFVSKSWLCVYRLPHTVFQLGKTYAPHWNGDISKLDWAPILPLQHWVLQEWLVFVQCCLKSLSNMSQMLRCLVAKSLCKFM